MAGSPTAHAADDRFEVPESCGTSAELDEALRARVGPRATGRGSVRLRHVVPEYELEVALENGVRVLRDRHCRALFQTAVLILALSLSEQPPPGKTADPGSPETVSAQPVDAPASPPERRKHPGAPFAFAHAGFAWGLTPALSAHVSLGGGYQRGRWGLRTRASYVLPREREGREGEGVRVQAFGGGAALTLELFRLLALHAGAELYALHGRGGTGLAAPRTGTALSWGPRVDAVLTLLRGRRAALELALATLYVPEPVQFRTAEGDLIARSRSWVVQGSLGAAFHFD